MRDRTRRLSLSMLLLLAGIAVMGAACSNGPAPSEGAMQITQEMVVSATPAFRNLGKRGESAL